MGHCRIVDLRCKEVINICDGCRLGFPYDVEVDMVTGRLVSIIVVGQSRFLGLFGRGEDYVVGWDRIKRIGDDVILVEYDICTLPKTKERRRLW